MLGAVARYGAARPLRRRYAAKAVEHVIGQLLPRGWNVGERNAAAIASARALEAEPAFAKIDPHAPLHRGRIDVPHLPLETIAVRKDP